MLEFSSTILTIPSTCRRCFLTPGLVDAVKLLLLL